MGKIKQVMINVTVPENLVKVTVDRAEYLSAQLQELEEYMEDLGLYRWIDPYIIRGWIVRDLDMKSGTLADEGYMNGGLKMVQEAVEELMAECANGTAGDEWGQYIDKVRIRGEECDVPTLLRMFLEREMFSNRIPQ